MKRPDIVRAIGVLLLGLTACPVMAQKPASLVQLPSGAAT